MSRDHVAARPFAEVVLPNELVVEAARYLDVTITAAFELCYDDGRESGWEPGWYDGVSRRSAHPLTGGALPERGEQDDLLIAWELPADGFAPNHAVADIVVDLAPSSIAPALVGSRATIALRPDTRGGAPVRPAVWRVAARLQRGPTTLTTGLREPLRWELVVDVADGDTLTDVTVRHALFEGVAFSSLEGVDGPAPFELGATTLPTDAVRQLAVTFARITGTAAAEDVVVAYEGVLLA